VQPHHHEYAETSQDIQAKILLLHRDPPFVDEMAIVIGLSEGYPEIDKNHNDEQLGREVCARGVPQVDDTWKRPPAATEAPFISGREAGMKSVSPPLVRGCRSERSLHSSQCIHP
jgi:hypothetical protein